MRPNGKPSLAEKSGLVAYFRQPFWRFTIAKMVSERSFAVSGDGDSYLGE